MSKVAVAYFSASGVTEDAAKKVAAAAGAELFAIRPETPYTQADLDWRNPKSRSSVEMQDSSCRPAMAPGAIPDADVYLVGFPIWWYTAPRIVQTFFEAGDFAGKRIVLFATSGSSGFGKTLADLKVSVPESTLVQEGLLVHGTADSETWAQWVRSLQL